MTRRLDFHPFGNGEVAFIHEAAYEIKRHWYDGWTARYSPDGFTNPMDFATELPDRATAVAACQHHYDTEVDDRLRHRRRRPLDHTDDPWLVARYTAAMIVATITLALFLKITIG